MEERTSLLIPEYHHRHHHHHHHRLHRGEGALGSNDEKFGYIVERIKRLACARKSSEYCVLDKMIDDSAQWTFALRDTQPRLQDGPMCGLVGLTMAAAVQGCDLQDIHTPVPDIARKIDDVSKRLLSHVRLMGYSLQGEMYNTQHMADTAKHMFACNCNVLPLTRRQLLQSFFEGGSVLVPYDAAPNHEPALRHGHNAHWALIVGVVYASTSDKIGSETGNQWKCINVPVVGASECTVIVNDILDSKTPSYVVARHGKSIHQGVWPLIDLIDSNLNLKKPKPSHAISSGFIIPNHLDALRGKFLVISATI